MKIPPLAKTLSVFIFALSVAGCQLDGDGGGGDSGNGGGDLGGGDVGGGGTGGGGTGGSGPGGGGGTVYEVLVDPATFTRSFVSKFDPVKVQRVRESARFAFQTIHYGMETGGKLFSGEWNSYRDIGVDYAHSAGLTGKGNVISIIDSMPLITHDEFSDAGKNIHISGSTERDDYHGTAVGAIAAGSAKSGLSMGVAPGADLHFGVMDFDRESSNLFGKLSSYMNDAKNLSAVVSNNSWSFPQTVQDAEANYLSQYSGGNNYLNSLREFGKNGVVVFSLSNDFNAPSASIMAGLPNQHSDLERHWLAVINAIPTFEGGQIVSARRVSSSCLEAARWCVAANGNLMVAGNGSRDPDKDPNSDYGLGVGTSYAAPQVSGSIALLSEAFPDLGPDQLRARLLVTANNGFFAHDGRVKFAEGIEHGYNSEWGHGFVDLKAALLPIGKLSTADAKGRPMSLDSTPIVSSTMTGDVIAKRLSKANVIIMDQMKGGFETSGDTLVGSDTRDRSQDNIKRIASLDLRALRASADAGGADSNHRLMANSSGLNFDAVPLSTSVSENMRVTVHLPAGERPDYGMGFMKGFDIESGRLDLGASFIQENGSVAGISSGNKMKAEHVSLDAAITGPITKHMSISLGGSIGIASGTADGMFSHIDTLLYDNLNLSLSRKGSVVDGDLLTFYAQRPSAISSGRADVMMASRNSSGAIEMGRTGIDLSPTARQIDIGFDYSRPVMDSMDIAFGVRHSLNSDNISIKNETSAVLGLQLSF